MDLHSQQCTGRDVGDSARLKKGPGLLCRAAGGSAPATHRTKAIVPSRSGGNPKHKSPSTPRRPGWQRCAPGPRTASPAARSSGRTAACEPRPRPYRLPVVQCSRSSSRKAGFQARLPRLLRRVSGRTGGNAGAGAGSPPPHKRVMENVVILMRGEPIPHMVAAALPAAGPIVAQAEKAEPADLRGALPGTDERVAAVANCGVQDKVDESLAAAEQSSSEAEKVDAVTAAGQRDAKAEEAGTMAAAVERGEQTKEEDEPVAFAGQSGAPAAIAEPAAAADKRVPDTEAKNAEAAEHHAAGAPAKAEPVAAPAHQTVLPQAEEETEQAPVATTGAATKAKQALPAAYSGPSFAAAAPDPRSLPIPVLLLKTRGRAARTIRAPPDDGRAPVPTAAAA
ncbi:hypothetical protein SETIT_2G205200v2 [Setaria italica]|uniref:Uncharacterized protein n=2 Tax=Setaria TaxID=4554 RepID=A0A368Q177_SETIT|nr:hypothetical protein SETIT_2G205200v2 [Setaria italica]